MKKIYILLVVAFAVGIFTFGCSKKTNMNDKETVVGEEYQTQMETKVVTEVVTNVAGEVVTKANGEAETVSKIVEVVVNVPATNKTTVTDGLNKQNQSINIINETQSEVNSKIKVSTKSLTLGEGVGKFEISFVGDPKEYDFQVTSVSTGTAETIFDIGEWTENRTSITVIGKQSGKKSYKIVACKNGYGEYYSDAIELTVVKTTNCPHDSWQGADCKTPKKCTGCGLELGETTGIHFYSYGDPYTCFVCGKKKEGYVGVDSITTEKDVIYLHPSCQYQIKFNVSPINATENLIDWSSNDPNLVTVDTNGLVYTNIYGKCGETVIQGINNRSGISVSVKVVVGSKCLEDITMTDNIWWAFEGNKLTVGGTRQIWFIEPRDSIDREQTCWNEISDSVEEIVLLDGITYVYVNCFDFKNLKTLTVPKSVNTFKGFFTTNEIVNVYLPMNSDLFKDFYSQWIKKNLIYK